MSPRISLAGRITVSVDGRRTDERELAGGQARLALAFLVSHRDRPVPREELAEALWPQGRPASWPTALRGVVGSVRRFVVASGLGGADALLASGGTWRLDLPDGVEVDVEVAAVDVERAEASLDVDPHRAVEHASRARAVLVRPLLAGIASPWLDDRREELSRLHLRALEVLAAGRTAVGDPEAAVAVAEEAVAIDPFRESVHRLLMHAHHGAGNTALALESFDRCRSLLADELGADPAPATTELHAELLRAAAAAHDAHQGTVAVAAATPAGARSSETACPYVGLQTFDVAHVDRFFGRSADTTALLDHVRDASFVAVVGPSGTGKSSLVRAGLVAALRRGALPGSDRWPITVLRPGAVPLKTLARELAALGMISDEAATARCLAEDHRALAGLLGAGTRRERTVLVVDQLEEVLSLCEDPAEQRAFTANLAAVASAGQDTVVVTLRADAYPRLVEHPEIGALVAAHQHLVTPMDEIGLAEAVTGPARVAGLEVGDGLVEAILRDVARRPGALPLLGHCLIEVWQRREQNVLSRAAYEASGGVDGALARRAELIWEELSAAEQVVARRILLRLTQAGPDGIGARRRVATSELATHPDEARTVEGVVDRFATARLLTTGGPPAAEPWVEVSHEALIRGWPRLQAWVDDAGAGLAVHRRLTARAQEWGRLDRDPGVLYSGAQLAEATAWAERHPDAANTLERDFLRASIDAVEQAQRAKARRTQLAVALLSIGVILFAALAGTALVQRDRATQAELLARSRQVAAEAVGTLALDPSAGARLAVEAVELAPTREAIAALRQALVTPRPVAELSRATGDVALTADGAGLVVGGAAGAEVVWEADGGALTLDGHSGRVRRVVPGPDPTLVAATDSEGVRIWDVASGQVVQHLPDDGGVAGVAWSPDGSTLATATDLATEIRLWSVTDGSEHSRLAPPGPVTFVAWALDGSALLGWSALDPELFLMDARTGEVIATLEGHEAPAVDARVSADGRYALSVGLDGTARLYDLAVGQLVGVSEGLAAEVWVGRFSPDGSTALVGDGTGTVRFIEVPTGATLAEATVHDDAVIDATFGSAGLAASISTDGSAALWDASDGALRQLLTLNGSPSLSIGPRAVAISPDGTEVVTRAATVQRWQVPETSAPVVAVHTRHVSTVAVSPDGRILASGSQDGTLVLTDLSDPSQQILAEVPDAGFVEASFSPDGSRLVTANPFQVTLTNIALAPRIWDVAAGTEIGVVDVPAPVRAPCPRVCETNAVDHSPDGRLILTAGIEGVVRLWDADTGREIRAFAETGRRLPDARFDPAGERVAAAAFDGVLVFDAASGEVERELDASAVAVAFDPAGTQLAAAGQDATATIWDPATGALLDELRHAANLTDVAFSPDGRFLLTAAGDGAHLWDVAAGQRIQSFTDGGGAHSVAFSPDGTLVTGLADGTVRLRACSVCGSVEELLEAARR